MRVAALALATLLIAAGCNERASSTSPPSTPSLATGAPGAPGAPGAGPDVDAAAIAPAREDAAAPRERCPASPWAMYGRDPARTSASDGCVDGALSVTWTFTRKGGCGYRSRAGRIVNVVADKDAIFATLDCGRSPGLMRVTPDGKPLWTFSRADFGRRHWPTLAGDAVVSTDDGVFFVDRETGKFHFHDLDVWGEGLFVDGRLFVDNTFQLDGYGPFVGAVDASLKWKWRASSINAGKGPRIPRTGGIAFADGRIVHAAAMGARSVPSLAAHDPDTGERRWIAPRTWPESAPSIQGGRVFVVERWRGDKDDRLVARSLDDGAVVWSQPIPWSRGPSPVVTDKLVILHGAQGVRAHDIATGALAWSNPTPRKARSAENATTLAAATGSHTLVVTSGARVVVLGLEDGAEKWSGDVVEGSSPTAPGGVTVECPVIVGRSVYVTSDGALLRLDPP